MTIPFNKPYLSGNELTYISNAITSGKISGDGIYTKKCTEFFEQKYSFKKCLLTTSCTDALEMSAILINLKEDDEVIMPSYTFVSTSNAFVLRGAKIKFIDSYAHHPNIDHTKIEAAITNKTKAIVVVHYAGVACAMDEIMAIAKKHNLFVIEDAAQAIDVFYKGKPLGSIGNLAAFSFHETKNIISGEGGMLVINDESMMERAEIIREKGTNRSKFFRGQVDKYTWVDIGSSFLPSDMIAAFLYAQLENLDAIQDKRKLIWDTYNECLAPMAKKYSFEMPSVPDFSTNNAHMFFITCHSIKQRTAVINHLKQNDILAVFHYLSLHKSDFYINNNPDLDLINSDMFTDNLLRLPLYFELSIEQVKMICGKIEEALIAFA
jgi:dTDP-4-amino-4,6-dideoxygalactose transaminase